MSSSKNIVFSDFLKGIELGYFGKPRMDAAVVEQQVAEAYARGQEEITQIMNNQILSQRTEVQHLLGETMEHLDRKVESCLKEIFDEIPALVTSIARRVLADVSLDGATIQAIVDDVISDLPSNKEEVQVFLSPEDLDLFRGYLENAEADYPHCRFEADPALGRADCRVLSHFGAIDARVDTKLKHIEDQLHS